MDGTADMARALNRINKRRKQRLGNDTVYGSGTDGDVTITGTTVLAEDMYYNNLTVNSGINLVTNGFRVFVKETLTNNGVIGLPSSAAGETGIGTLVGRVKDGTAGVPKSYVVGESASGTQVPASALRNLDFVIRGWHIDPTDGFKRIEGADDGTAGADVAGSAGAAGTSGTSGTAGTAGGAAGGGTSTAGTDGTDGGDGTDGTDGATGATGIGGAGGAGGGMVLVVAKKVAGTGTIRSDGSVGDAGATGAKGADGTDGTAGTPGAAGTKGNDDLAVLLDSYEVPGLPAFSFVCGSHEVCETVPFEWVWVEVPGYGPFAFTTWEIEGVTGGPNRGAKCVTVEDICHDPGHPPIPVFIWQDGQSTSYYGGAAGAAGAGGAKGLGGAGGAGGTGETGTTGGEGSVFLVTDSDDVPAGMMVGTYKTTIVNA